MCAEYYFVYIKDRGAHPVARVADTLYRSTIPGGPVQRRLPILEHPSIGVPLYQLCLGKVF